ncbi:hypothetical protein [Noviherbaspirillum soli]|uniref:hypothetical protein n=1 Tax=Noviherbaspirillum soli TaxID=1064518 RepID=UPI00188A65C4|nr:hypothetical protein [Noviherbaspirillum soli]
MIENFSSHNCQLSLVELSDVSGGREGDIFAGEYTNSGNQVGSMTINELRDFFKTHKLSYCISYVRDGYNVTSWDSNQLFPSKNTFFLPRT